MSEKKDYLWDARVQRYRYRLTGRFVKNSTIVRLTERNIETKQNYLQTLFTDLITGKTDLIGFQREAKETLKILHTQQYLVSRGGFGNTNSADYLAIGRSLKDEHFVKLRALAKDLNEGKLTEKQARLRLTNLGQASRSSHLFGQQKSYQEAGYAYARRFLSPADHCIDCPIYAAMGVVSIEQLILPTQQCECRHNCKCYVRYYTTLEEATRST